MKETTSGLMGSRRRFVGAAAALAASGLTGCIGRSEATVEVTVTARDAAGIEEDIIESTETIQPHDYFAWELNLDWGYEVGFEVEVTEGPRVHLYLLEDEEMQAFREGSEFHAVEDAVWGSVRSLSEFVDLEEGDYWLVAINDDVEPENLRRDDEDDEEDGDEEGDDEEQEDE